MAAEHTLILGGARSGKTGFAEAMAIELGESPVYLATAEALDTEMEERVAAHRWKRRGRFTTVEEPLEVTKAILRASVHHDVILVDCLTLWITNLLASGADVADLVEELGATLGELTRCTVLLVSNEVGLGIVPDNPLARNFRDLAGATHQRLGEICTNVYFVVAGLPMTLKGTPPPSAGGATVHEA